MTNMIRTRVFAEEEKEFRLYLENSGFSDFDLFPNKDAIYLNILFHKPATIMNYTLRGIESKYRATRSNTYYYDLDQDWDDEADLFFGDEDDF
jgi:hypothetical protein